MRPSRALLVLPLLTACASPPPGEEATEDEIVSVASPATVVDSVFEEGAADPVWAVDARDRVWLSHGLSFGQPGQQKAQALPAASSSLLVSGENAFALSRMSASGSRTLSRISLASKTSTPLHDLGGPAYGFTTDRGGALYMIGVASPGTPPTRLLRVNPTTSNVDVISEDFGQGACPIVQLLVDEASVYGWRRCYPESGQLVQVSRTGGPTKALVETSRVASNVAQSDTDLFYSSLGIELVRLPKAGGAPSTLVRGALGRVLAVRGNEVWFIDAMEVKRVPMAGGSATTVAPLPTGVEPKAMFPTADGVLVHVKLRNTRPGESNHQLIRVKLNRASSAP